MKQLLTLISAIAFLLFADGGHAAPQASGTAIPADVGWERGSLLKGGSAIELAERKAEAGQYKAAAKLFDKAFDAAVTIEGHAYALRRTAECQYRNGNYYKAQKSYKRLLESYAPYIPLESTLKIQRDLAEKFASGEANALGFKNIELAIEVYETVLNAAPGGANAPADMTRLATLQNTGGNPADAVDTLRELIRRFPSTPEEEAARLSIATFLIEQGRYGDGDGSYNRAARQEMLLFIADHPESRRLADARTLLAGANEAMAGHLVNLGFFYLRKYSYRPNTARRYFYDAVRLYPGTNAAKIAQQQLDKLEPGAAARALAEAEAAGKPKPSEPKPEPIRLLEQKEKMDKYLLPLEDYSDYLRNSHEARTPRKPVEKSDK